MNRFVVLVPPECECSVHNVARPLHTDSSREEVISLLSIEWQRLPAHVNGERYFGDRSRSGYTAPLLKVGGVVEVPVWYLEELCDDGVYRFKPPRVLTVEEWFAASELLADPEYPDDLRSV